MVTGLYSTPIVVDAFVGHREAGNRHLVYYCEFDINDGLIRETASNSSALIHVFVHYYCSAYHLRFYQNEQEILFCGSGVLAAARYLIHYNPLLHFPIQLELKNNSVMAFFDTNRIYFSLKLADIYRPFNTAIASTLVNQPVVSAYQLGRGDGYLLVELDSEKHVQQAKPRLYKMRYRGGPALIITAAAKCSAKQDYVMRYFAPQYGNDEDQATGSANVYLMHYWSRRLRKNTLRAIQLSTGGGRFYGKVKKNTVLLGGEVEVRH